MRPTYAKTPGSFGGRVSSCWAQETRKGVRDRGTQPKAGQYVDLVKQGGSMDPNQMTANEVAWLVGIMTVIGGVIGTVVGFLLSWGSAALSARHTKNQILCALKYEINHNLEIVRALRENPISVLVNYRDLPEFAHNVWDSQQIVLPQILNPKSFKDVYHFYYTLSKCSSYGRPSVSYGVNQEPYARLQPELRRTLDLLISEGNPLQ